MIIRTIALMLAIVVINVSSTYIEELIARSQGSTHERLLTAHTKITQSGFISLFELKVYARNLISLVGSFTHDREQFVQIFVRLLHEAIQEGGALTVERINEIWFEAMEEVRLLQERSAGDRRLQESIAHNGYIPTTALALAIAQGDAVEIDRLLADAAYDVNQQEGEAIYVAVLKNDAVSVRKLLAAHARISVGESRSLWAAIALNFDEILMLLAEYDGNDSN